MKPDSELTRSEVAVLTRLERLANEAELPPEIRETVDRALARAREFRERLEKWEPQ